MKNRKIILVAFMLVACMVVGIGYAALSAELTVTGNATFKADKAQDEFTGDINFTDDIEKAAENTASLVSGKSIEIGITNLALMGETTSFTFNIENTSLEHDATLSVKSLKFMGTAITDDDSDGIYEDEWLSAKIEWPGPNTTTLKAAADESTPGTAQLKITFTLKQSPTETVVRTINIAIDATTTN